MKRKDGKNYFRVNGIQSNKKYIRGQRINYLRGIDTVYSQEEIMKKVYETIIFPKFFKPEPLRLNLQFFADEPPAGDTPPPGDTPPGDDNPPTPLTTEDIQKIIQSEVDKVRTKSAKEIKAAEDKVKALQNEKLTDQEKFELAKQELAEKTKTLQERENVIFAKDALAASELDASFLEFVRAENEEGTTAKVQALKTAYDKAVSAGIEAHIKGTGRSFPKGSGGGTNLSEGAEFAQNLNSQKAPTGPSLWGN